MGTLREFKESLFNLGFDGVSPKRVQITDQTDGWESDAKEVKYEGRNHVPAILNVINQEVKESFDTLGVNYDEAEFINLVYDGELLRITVDGALIKPKTEVCWGEKRSNDPYWRFLRVNQEDNGISIQIVRTKGLGFKEYREEIHLSRENAESVSRILLSHLKNTKP